VRVVGVVGAALYPLGCAGDDLAWPLKGEVDLAKLGRKIARHLYI